MSHLLGIVSTYQNIPSKWYNEKLLLRPAETDRENHRLIEISGGIITGNSIKLNINAVEIIDNPVRENLNPELFDGKSGQPKI